MTLKPLLEDGSRENCARRSLDLHLARLAASQANNSPGVGREKKLLLFCFHCLPVSREICRTDQDSLRNGPSQAVTLRHRRDLRWSPEPTSSPLIRMYPGAGVVLLTKAVQPPFRPRRACLLAIDSKAVVFPAPRAQQIRTWLERVGLGRQSVVLPKPRGGHESASSIDCSRGLWSKAPDR